MIRIIVTALLIAVATPVSASEEQLIIDWLLLPDGRSVLRPTFPAPFPIPELGFVVSPLVYGICSAYTGSEFASVPFTPLDRGWDCFFFPQTGVLETTSFTGSGEVSQVDGR